MFAYHGLGIWLQSLYSRILLPTSNQEKQISPSHESDTTSVFPNGSVEPVIICSFHGMKTISRNRKWEMFPLRETFLREFW